MPQPSPTIAPMPELSGLIARDDADTRALTSYSFWNTFRNCRRQCHWRYREGLRVADRAAALAQGDAVHQGLEAWYGTGDASDALLAVDKAILGTDHEYDAPFVDLLQEGWPMPDWFTLDPARRERWHIATAMVKAYIATYPTEAWRVIGLEVPFVGEIINPDTGRSSRSFILGGKVDGVVHIEGEGYFILEHKTTSRLDAGYLDKLWTDMQIQLYASYIRPNDEPIAGVIYNILEKPALKMKMGETDAEFQARLAEMKMPNRAKQQQAETDLEFQDRLTGWFEYESRFHREVIYFTPNDLRELRANLWEMTQQYLEAARGDDAAGFYRNTSQCYQYNRACDYVQLCRAGGAANINSLIRTSYTRTNAPAGGELAADGDAGELVW